MSWFKRAGAPVEAARCTFCNAARAEVKVLVAKDAGTASCERCIATALAVIDNTAVGNVALAYPTLGLSYGELIESAPLESWERLPMLARGLLALRSTPAVELLRLAGMCAARNHDAARQAALLLYRDVVNVAEFGPRDAVAMGYLAYDLGDYSAVRRAVTILVPNATIDDPTMLDLAALTLLVDVVEQREVVAPATASRARGLADLAVAVGDAAVASRARAVAAWVLHLHGDDLGAIEHYQAVAAQWPLLPRSAVPYADALARTGQRSLAVEVWQQVIADNTASAHWRAEAQARLAQPTNAYR